MKKYLANSIDAYGSMMGCYAERPFMAGFNANRNRYGAWFCSIAASSVNAVENQSFSLFALSSNNA